ncbi:hypothetical protein JCM8202v2_004702 [Rhodotorula sphaerocarpa]
MAAEHDEDKDDDDLYIDGAYDERERFFARHGRDPPRHDWRDDELDPAPSAAEARLQRTDSDDSLQILAGRARAGSAPKFEPQGEPERDVAGAAPTFEQGVQAILAILPDLSVRHVKAQLMLQTGYGPANVEAVLEGFLSMEEGYPKEELDSAAGASQSKGKGRAVDASMERGVAMGAKGLVGLTVDEDEEIEREAQVWLDADKRAWKTAVPYREAAIDQLARDFPRVRLADVRALFLASKNLYTQTVLRIRADAAAGTISLMQTTRADKGKGKLKTDDEFERERQWVVHGLPKYERLKRRRLEAQKQLEEEVASGAFFECGCCFSDTAISQMITCSEGCQFCRECARGNAANEIGLRKYVLKCMSTDGCSATFPESELVKCLSSKTLGALHKIKQEKEVDEAAIEGLVKCPFCPYAMIMENPEERLFRCQRDDCQIVSCISCRKRDHLPKTCAEVSDAELKLKSAHTVEEAMSEALIRRCPKVGCGEPYVKEAESCSKIRCSNCGTLSCYVCNKVIYGYEHFKNPGTNLPAGKKVESGATCALWDDTAYRNFREVEAAREAAEAQARKLNRDVELKDDDFKALKMQEPPPNLKYKRVEPAGAPAKLAAAALAKAARKEEAARLKAALPAAPASHVQRQVVGRVDPFPPPAPAAPAFVSRRKVVGGGAQPLAGPAAPPAFVSRRQVVGGGAHPPAGPAAPPAFVSRRQVVGAGAQPLAGPAAAPAAPAAGPAPKQDRVQREWERKRQQQAAFADPPAPAAGPSRAAPAAGADRGRKLPPKAVAAGRNYGWDERPSDDEDVGAEPLRRFRGDPPGPMYKWSQAAVDRHFKKRDVELAGMRAEKERLLAELDDEMRAARRMGLKDEVEAAERLVRRFRPPPPPPAAAGAAADADAAAAVKKPPQGGPAPRSGVRSGKAAELAGAPPPARPALHAYPAAAGRAGPSGAEAGPAPRKDRVERAGFASSSAKRRATFAGPGGGGGGDAVREAKRARLSGGNNTPV